MLNIVSVSHRLDANSRDYLKEIELNNIEKKGIYALITCKLETAAFVYMLAWATGLELMLLHHLLTGRQKHCW